MTQNTATLLGFVAVAFWGLLAFFTVGAQPTPPFLLNSLCFTIAGLTGLIWCAVSRRLYKLRTIPIRVYVFGTLGLFGYHALYFTALSLAPAAEASLIAYLWPLLIVLFSGALPGERLRLGHIVGATVGFAGAFLIVTAGKPALMADALPGYVIALCCALTWSTYSILSRLNGSIPTESVAVFCLGSALLSYPLHLMFEPPVWPNDPKIWMNIFALGLGPVGLAFYLWDIGVKKGNIQLLGTASYAAPLISTLVLVFAGIAAASWVLALAALCITSGAVIAARASKQH